LGCYLRGAEADRDGAQAAQRGFPTRLPLDQSTPASRPASLALEPCFGSV
jgi:hypothetical protein